MFKVTSVTIFFFSDEIEHLISYKAWHALLIHHNEESSFSLHSHCSNDGSIVKKKDTAL